ncbi:hypothetical protein A6P36_05345 [Candidatus Arthromitus sp. SFB-turkey]|nr:hypothetical protein A6P36_05345 [Candidatus Arthromitus sp. SFB-turkey]
MELNYEDTSSVKDADNNEVNTGSHQDFFEPLNEETYAEDTVTKEEVEEVTDAKKLEEVAEVVEAEKIEEVLEVVEEIEEAVELEESEVIEAEEVEENEEISVESEDEVVEVNDEFPSSASGLETDMTPTSDESIEPPSLDMEDGYEVGTELDEYGNVVEVFASVNGRSVTPFTLNDTRLPSAVTKPVGTVSHFGETKGGVDFSISTTATNIHDRYKFQGTAKPSLVFTGEILDARATVSLVSTFDGSDIVLRNTTGSVISGTLREFLIRAANEKIDEINGTKVDSVSSIDDRTYLTLALSYILSANNATASNLGLSLTFKDLDSVIPKQTTLDFVASTIFTTGLDIVKNIVNEDSFVSNRDGISKNSRNVSNINLNPEGISVNIDLKVEKPENGLKTNTRYEFVAPNRDLVFFPIADSTVSLTASAINYVEGLTMTPFKTGKQLPLFETLSVVNSTTLAVSGMIALEEITSTTSVVSYVDFNSIDDTTYLDYDDMISVGASNVALKVGGTTVRFNTFKIYDLDSTITKIEVEDDRMDKYPVTLIPVDSNDSKKGANPQITGLQRSMPYNFRKLHITAQPESEVVTKTLTFATFSVSGTKVTALPTHSHVIRTTAFSEPILFIELDSDKAFVSTTTGNPSSSSSGSAVPVFIPKFEVELPNKIKMPVVTNDKTSLRYVIEVEKSDITVKDLIVNGLKGNEKYKVEKIDGKDIIYFIVTLSELSEKRDYGFLILELSYIDLDGRDLVTRQVLNKINNITHLNIGSQAPFVLTQFPDETQDNTTGPELMGNAIFNVTLFEATTLEARKAEIPLFIDDMNGRFLRMEFKKPEGNPAVEVELEGSILRFTNLEPKSEVVYKLDFIWKDKDNKEQTLSKYAKISTPAVPAVDVKGTTITTTSSTAEIVFELFSHPKSTISGVTLSDEKIKFTWNRDKLTLNLERLKPNTEYKDLEITFKLENGLITKYKIETFKTKEEVKPPTGNVADFVARIYEAALGRKPEVEGWRFWVQKLESKELSVTQFVYDLMAQDEFVNRFLSKEDFIKMMYIIVVGREPEEEGQKYWERKYDEYKLQEPSLADLRRRIATEMMSEPEFKDYVTKIGLKY